jgi:hypothetical protein
MKLIQIRSCDGKCCKESPRFPNSAHSDCIFHDEKGCKIMRGEAEALEEASPVLPSMTAKEAFNQTCVNWPQNSPEGRGTGGCCWQWVED